jgi:hypothetical protein
MHLIITASYDGLVKLWSLAPDTLTFDLKATKDLKTPVFSMQMVADDRLLIGLENGNYAMWNFSNDQVDRMPAHLGDYPAITILQR